MPAETMHADEVDIDSALVGRLVAAQFLEWAALPIEPVPFFGTENALYWLGNDMVVRMPRRERTSGKLEKERRWLPRRWLAEVLAADAKRSPEAL